MEWVIFSLLSRALWAADNIVDKLLIGKHLKNPLILTFVAGISSLLLALIIILFNGLSWIGPVPVALAVFAGSFQIIAVFAFYQAISKEEISRVIPLFQLTPPFVLILSFLFLGEVLTRPQYLAFILILIGGFLISLKRIEGVFKLRNAFWLMVLSSLIYAIQIVILKPLYVSYPFWDLTVYLIFGQFLPTPLLLLIPNFKNRLVDNFSNLKPVGWILLIMAMLFVAGASLSINWALITGPVTLISVTRGFQSAFVLIFTVFLSIWFPKILKEELSKSALGVKVLAIFLMFLGLYLIYQ
ncbi:MAG: hypothetical protein A2186_00410 [Candidatus Levybacteria bacterium RIFOXYA1_FULL_41_10]|nr:MAG: Conserved hypothetical membrane protein, DUF6 family [Candidatus Levybacteria bacterium GW2011_GWA1_39_32]KKR50911.1 MAG: Conserved hypothetical membrane protein, DUF6 family [Candidatus Levybacteria bacterium GW2011_GWC1_40_19]KKR94063.1 MAG: Conserved hypothetical membrane protein, DUF6 family [Candidatus Levybacteria bacterium GW2011_GWA2_41_15]KKS01184.1 MAG: Conserved hypothetical membrane protein, DUF6 family [Candidatus Levybacteria bacterium GW2011_GWB1_41_21]OGH21129.1 MAG: hyp